MFDEKLMNVKGYFLPLIAGKPGYLGSGMYSHPRLGDWVPRPLVAICSANKKTLF